MGTNSDAVPASQAAVFEEHQIRLRVLALRIVAPPARQGTTFEENRGPNAGAIVQGIALDVKNEASRLPRGGVGSLAKNSGLVFDSSHPCNSQSRMAHVPTLFLGMYAPFDLGDLRGQKCCNVKVIEMLRVLCVKA
jgi:hypothetical protein